MKIDNTLIADCKHQKSSSQKRLFEVSLPYTRAIVYRYIFNKSFEKDAIQEIYVKIFKGVIHFDEGKGSFYNWMAKIAVNTTISFNKKYNKRLEELDQATQVLPIIPGPIYELEYEELIQLLKAMPEELYTIFNLFIIDGFSHVEIAKTLGISPSLSRKRLSRAREWAKNNMDYDGQSIRSISKNNIQ